MRRLFNEHNVRRVLDLGGRWTFTTDEKGIGLDLDYQNGFEGQSVIVPSVWNTELGLLNYEGKAWYKREFYTQGGTIRFVFESVMTEATVFLDGKEITSHYGGFTAFDVIVRNIKEGNHTLVLLADNTPTKKSIPQKKVDWFNYGGIARDVWAETLNGISILSSNIEYELDNNLKNATLCANLVLFNASNEQISSSVSVFVDKTQIYNSIITLDAYERIELKTPLFMLENIELWDTENPRLYTVTVATDTDDLIDKIGFRKIEARDTKILLNGKEIEFRGVNRHEEHPDFGFAFPSKLMKKDIDMILYLDCNTIRGAHYPQSKIFVDMLDERGILFWSEIPIWGGGFDDSVLTDPDVVNRGLTMHDEMTKQYYNHPSIIIWGMHNEIYTLYPCTFGISKQYSEFLRKNGGNRLITHAAAFPFDDSSFEFDDIICINMYKGWYGGYFSEWDTFVNDFAKKRIEQGIEDKPVIISEFGAGALSGFHSHFDSVRWSEEYQAELLKYCIELFDKTDYIKGYYIWQFCNIRTYHQMDLNRVRCFNNKGIVDEYRNPKSAYFTIKELNKKVFQK